jgi:outer membrane lipoprotein-sorting protein
MRNWVIVLALTLGGAATVAPAQDSNRVTAAEASDAAALQVLRQMCDVYTKASSMSYEAELVSYRTGAKGKTSDKDRIVIKAEIAIEKPNLLRIDVMSDSPGMVGTLVCDGEKVWQYAKDDNRYTSSPAPSEPDLIRGTLAGLAQFARQLPLAKDPYARMMDDGSFYTIQSPDKLGDVECDVIRRASPQGWSMLIWVDRERHLVQQTRLEYVVPEGRQILIMKRSKIRIAPKLSPDVFRFVPPRDAQLIPEPPSLGIPSGG